MSGSILPPDLRAQVPRSGAGGIGGAARENATTARQRDVAMGQAPPEAEDAAVEKEEEEVLVKVCPNGRCAAKVADDQNFCPKCGQDLLRTGMAAKKLNITFTDTDVQDYLFKGYVIRELKLLGKHTVVVKSSQAEELGQVDDYIMNKLLTKSEDGTDRRVSDFYLRQMNALCVTASALVKIDGEGIGENLEDRLSFLKSKGSALVDLLSERVTLFNRALTEYIRKVDNILGS